MGINPTSLFKTFSFDGDSSGTYGAFLTGEGVFNAPERAVDMVEIPGRNGAFAMDKGRFENVEVTYNGGLVDYNETDFADRISALRNWLCSKVGYVRLEDDYNPDEYRMAIYKSGLEVDSANLKTGEFEITFECKPQRWLKSGESAQAVANNGTLTNPELFESSPLLAVKGYGDISFNGYTINIENAMFGDIQISDKTKDEALLDISNCNTGDLMYTVETGGSNVYLGYYNFKITGRLGATVGGNPGGSGTVTNTATHYIGTAWTRNVTRTLNNQAVTQGGTTHSVDISIVFSMHYDGDHTITFAPTMTVTGIDPKYINLTSNCWIYAHWCDSTKSTLGNPTYIDCDLGEAYLINSDDEIVQLNNVVGLGSDLPVLASGSNTFTYDNTITELKVTPRWWRV